MLNSIYKSKIRIKVHVLNVSSSFASLMDEMFNKYNCNINILYVIIVNYVSSLHLLQLRKAKP